MNKAEAKMVLQKFFSCFPDVDNWMRYASAEPMHTCESWRRCLMQVPFRQAMEVVEALAMGQEKTLEPYHRYRYAIYIVDLTRERCQKMEKNREQQVRAAAFRLAQQQKKELRKRREDQRI